MIDFERRFGGIARLYGESALTSFKQAHVCVIGVGGVGSWAVEGLARSAIGKITMIDLDHLSESNVNRQLHALTDTLGQSKVDALAERIAQINPYCVVTRVEEFIDPDNVATLIPVGQFDYVIDAIDNTRAKTALVVHCRANHIPLVTIGSAGGQVDPTRIAVCDLSRTEQEPLLARVRKRLRRLHGFPRGTKNKFGIDAVYSTEPVRHPELCATDDETKLMKVLTVLIAQATAQPLLLPPALDLSLRVWYYASWLSKVTRVTKVRLQLHMPKSECISNHGHGREAHRSTRYHW